jgi:hypothetical protein
MMNINFDTLKDHIVPISDFELAWRFEDFKDVSQLISLDTSAAQFLNSIIKDNKLRQNEPFKTGLFSQIDNFEIEDNNKPLVKEWLFNTGIPIHSEVYLSWNPDTAMMTTWLSVTRYFDDLFYPASDDLIVFDRSLNWAILFHHMGCVFFGRK